MAASYQDLQGPVPGTPWYCRQWLPRRDPLLLRALLFQSCLLTPKYQLSNQE